LKSKDRFSLLRISVFLATSPLLLLSLSARAQTVTATVTVGAAPHGMATNTMTNKIYVANFLRGSGVSSGNVTVIDGATNSTTTVPAGLHPVAVAVNEVTNKIYVVSAGDCTPLGKCTSKGSVTVIDGATNSTTTVTDANANGPQAVALNPVTNKIYVANFLSSNITVIDGVTNSTTTVTDPSAFGLAVYAIAVNQMTNKIYALNNNSGRTGSNPGNVTVIDGATNSITTVTDPNAIAPFAVAVNQVTNKIYVANEGAYPAANHGNITVIDGATNSITTVTDPNALAPQAVAVDPATNKIYVANANDSTLSGNGGVTVIDGATNSFVTVKDHNAIFPASLAVDSATNKIYVANMGNVPDGGNNPGSVTVIDGVTNSPVTVINPRANAPVAVAVDSATDKIYVANENSGNVTVIDGSAKPSDFTVSVIDSGSGTGTVTSNPPGINCPSSCSASFALGTMVGLTASPASGSTFTVWSGACSSVGACNVTTTGFVTATFNTAPPPDFSLSPASASLTLQHGAQNTDVITLAPQNGPFATAILLTCVVAAGPAPLPTCGLNPTSVTPGANSATSTLTITAATTAAMLNPSGRWPLSKSLFALWLPLTLVMIAVGGSKKLRRQCWVLGGFLLLLLLFQTACAGGGGGTITTPVNYTVTVTAASGSIQHTTPVTVTVQ
jgi:DNA-binding beta-propeller fold protein YncE